MYRIGIDVGGTFTDLVAVDPSGRATLAKVASTPQDPSVGVMDGLARLAEVLGLPVAKMFAETERIVHGTTVATNALLERKGAKVGLLTTEGHRDVIEMREGLKDDRYNLRMKPPEQLVPRARRLAVRERIRADGGIATPLDTTSLENAIAQLKEDEVEAVAVCYLHSYRDARHERATGEALAKAMPGVYVSLSSDVFPQIKEFDRVSTTVVNAYVGPILSRYLRRLGERLQAAGYKGPVLIIQSHGGVAPIVEAARLAAGAVLSGPAGGVAGSRYAAKLLGHGNLIPFDMGGTSTDICLIVDGEATLAVDRKVGDHRVALNSLDIVTLGAGGGSIGRIDAGGILHVGPESAGAYPGPACYGRGGTLATVTDANLVLGYLDPAHFLGGRATLDLQAAETAVGALAARLGVDRIAAAEGVHRVVNTNMAEGIRIVSVRRGVDPRKFALLSFGGAAGLHVTDVARQLDLGRVVVPRVAAVLSAWGMLATDLRFEVARTHIGDAKHLDGAATRRLFDEMAEEATRRLRASFDGPMRLQRSVDMRYGEQIFEINVPLDDMDWNLADPLPEIVERFHRRHEELYTYAMREQDAVLVNARVVAVGLLPDLPQEPSLPPSAPKQPSGERRIYLGDWKTVPVYDFDALAPAQTIAGPAIVESAMTTVLLRPKDHATLTSHGWLDISVPIRGS
ncbi:MAG: hydantoinase/oxoprolinase family protein [Alphaproteobacteria bacterium]|nr:hydantoinase/oxoprolinase family protein [Alphaproteobacteria bacterium]